MKLNNKGFVASTLMYSLLILFLFLILGLIALLSNRKMILDKLKNDIKEEVNSTKKYTYYENGTPIYFNPVTNKICGNYTEENSLNETKTGCLKWYIFNDDINKASVNMILDHNTSSNVAWNSSGNNTDGMKEVKDRLEEDTNKWDKNLNPRLITADEIAHIVGADSEDTIKWKQSKSYGTDDTITKVSWFYLDGSGTSYSDSDGWKKQLSNSTNKSKYAWLFDYTYNCETYGCNINESNNIKKGYWTSTRVNGNSANNQAWFIYRIGSLDYALITRTDIGVRPVISVDKKELNKLDNLQLTKFIINLEKNNNNDLTYDNTVDNNLRYIGNNPNNYVYFNNELWRIIGIMNNIDNNGKVESRVKLIRKDSIGLYAWNEVNDNTWGSSTLANYLNNEYYNNLSSNSKELIENATWNISKINFVNSAYTYYTAERLNSNDSSNVWNGKIGLYYPSDFGFATGGNNKEVCLNAELYSTVNSKFQNCYKDTDGCLSNNWLYDGNETWFINPGDDATRVMFLYPEGYIDYGGNHSSPKAKINVYPTVYLKSNVLLERGNGTVEYPYYIK